MKCKNCDESILGINSIAVLDEETRNIGYYATERMGDEMMWADFRSLFKDSIAPVHSTQCSSLQNLREYTHEYLKHKLLVFKTYRELENGDLSGWISENYEKLNASLFACAHNAIEFLPQGLNDTPHWRAADGPLANFLLQPVCVRAKAHAELFHLQALVWQEQTTRSGPVCVVPSSMETWNFWRARYGEEAIDMSGISLPGIRFPTNKTVDGFLAAHSMSGIINRDIDVTQIELSEKDIEMLQDFDSEFALYKLIGVETGIEGINFSKVIVEDANFSKADMGLVNLSGASGKGANFSGARMNGANLENASLQSGNFEGADLRYALANYADLRRCCLDGAISPRVDYVHADLSGSTIRNANFMSAFFTDADLSGSDLSGTNFIATHLDHARVNGAKFANCNISGALVYGVGAWNCDFEGAVQKSFAAEQAI